METRQNMTLRERVAVGCASPLCVVLLAAGLISWLVWPAWHAWFSVDDTAVLLCAQYPVGDLLLDRSTAAFCNPLFFTPLWPLLFKLDTRFWELAPAGYRLVNLAIAAMACLMLWLLVRPVAGRVAAWIAVVALALSMPTIFGVSWITRRHYLTGLALALTTVWAFMRYRNRQLAGGSQTDWPWLLSSTLAYFLAVLSKEAYAFVPVLLFILATGGLRRRLWLMVPYVVALLSYLAWRWWMLGGIGGYPTTGVSPADLAVRAWEQLSGLPNELYGAAAPALVIPMALLAHARRPQAIFLAVAFLASLSPYLLYPGSGFNHASKAFAACAIVAVGLGLAWDRAARSLSARVLLAASLLALFWGSWHASSAAAQRARGMGEQFEARYRATYASGVASVLVLGDYPYYFTAMNQLHGLLDTGEARDLVAISSRLALPRFADRAYDRIVLQDGRSLDGGAAATFVSERLETLYAKPQLPPPTVLAASRKNGILFESRVAPNEYVVRCMIRSDYGNCIEVGPRYLMPYPAREPILWLDFHRVTYDGRYSMPTAIDPATIEPPG